MRDIDQGLLAEHDGLGGHQKGPIGPTKGQDHPLDGPAIAARLGDQLGHGAWSTNPSAFGVDLGQGAEHPLRKPLVLLGKAREGLVGMVRQRLAQHSDFGVVPEAEHLLPRDLSPNPHQRMLHQRQLVARLPDFVQKPIHQLRLDLSPIETDRPLDRLAPSASRQSGNKVLIVIERFGQPFELVAVAQEVGAQGQNHIDRVGSLGQLEEPCDECFGLSAMDGVAPQPKPKGLLELIDQQEQIRPIVPQGRLQRLEQGMHSFVEQPRSKSRCIGKGRVSRLKRRQRRDQRFEGAGTGAQGRDPPSIPFGHQPTRFEGGNQTGANQRRLATPRVAEDRNKAGAVELFE